MIGNIGRPCSFQCRGSLVASANAHRLGGCVVTLVTDRISTSDCPIAIVACRCIGMSNFKGTTILVKCLNVFIAHQACNICVGYAIILFFDIFWPCAYQGWGGLIATANAHRLGGCVVTLVTDRISTSDCPIAIVACRCIGMSNFKGTTILVKCLNVFIAHQACNICVGYAIILFFDIFWPCAYQGWGGLIATANAHRLGGCVVTLVTDRISTSDCPIAIVACRCIG